jgi:hypothetical protein
MEKLFFSPSESVNLSACVVAKISDESFLKEKLASEKKPGEWEGVKEMKTRHQFHFCNFKARKKKQYKNEVKIFAKASNLCTRLQATIIKRKLQTLMILFFCFVQGRKESQKQWSLSFVSEKLEN